MKLLFSIPKINLFESNPLVQKLIDKKSIKNAQLLLHEAESSFNFIHSLKGKLQYLFSSENDYYFQLNFVCTLEKLDYIINCLDLHFCVETNCFIINNQIKAEINILPNDKN